MSGICCLFANVCFTRGLFGFHYTVLNFLYLHEQMMYSINIRVMTVFLLIMFLRLSLSKIVTEDDAKWSGFKKMPYVEDELNAESLNLLSPRKCIFGENDFNEKSR